MTSEKSGIRRAEIGSAIAIVFSVLAVVVSFYQARIAEKQAHASVWPYLSIGYTITDQGDQVGFALTVDNDGLGPAVIESVAVSVDGVPRTHWSDVTAAIGIPNTASRTMSSLAGRVLPPNINRETTISAIHMHTIDDAKTFSRALPRLKFEICYCSVYDECWIARFMQQHVDRVSRCEPDAVAFLD